MIYASPQTVTMNPFCPPRRGFRSGKPAKPSQASRRRALQHRRERLDNPPAVLLFDRRLAR